jgi:hypothetical protein
MSRLREYERQIRQQLTDMFAFGLRCIPRHCRDHPEPLGARLCEPGSRILFRQGWQTRAGRCSSGSPIRKNRLRQRGSLRNARSQIFDYRGESCGGAGAGSGAEGLSGGVAETGRRCRGPTLQGMCTFLSLQLSFFAQKIVCLFSCILA